MHAASHQVHSQPPGASRGPVIRGVRRSRLESRAWKVIPDLGLPGLGGPSSGGGDLGSRVPERWDPGRHSPRASGVRQQSKQLAEKGRR